MWILWLIPDEYLRFFIHAIVVLGAILYFSSGVVGFLTKKWFVQANLTAKGIQVIGLVVLLAGVFFEGGYGVELTWRQKMAELQDRIDQAEIESAQANEALVEEQAKRERDIQQVTNDIRGQIQIQKVYINQKCELDPAAVELYRQLTAGGGGKK